MKYLIIPIALLLTSCAISNKTTEENIKFKDTVTIPEYHAHINIDGEETCFYFESESYEVTYTIYPEKCD